MQNSKSQPTQKLHFALRTIVLVAAIAISPLASGADLRCGTSGVYFRDWPSQEEDYTLLSKNNFGGYSATAVVTKTGPCRPCHYTTDEKHGPIPLPAGRYTEFNGKLMFWDGHRWIAVGYEVSPYVMGTLQLRSYENVLSIRSTPAPGGNGKCVSTQISSGSTLTPVSHAGPFL